MTMPKEYLGDAVYVEYDGYHIVLTTEDGISTTNRICLDPDVMAALSRYGRKLIEQLDKAKPSPV